MQQGMVGVGIYWCIVEMLYEEGGYLPLEYDRITFELRTDIDVVKKVVNDFELFIVAGDSFYSQSVLDRLQERCDKSEKAKANINKRWNKLGKHTNVIRPVSDRNTIKDSKVKEKKIYSTEFESFWNTYPKKIGKDAAWKAWVKRNGSLPEINIILTALEAQKKADAWTKDKGQFIPNPATWINQGRWMDEIKVEKAGW
jgi:hypothetical protein